MTTFARASAPAEAWPPQLIAARASRGPAPSASATACPSGRPSPRRERRATSVAATATNRPATCSRQASPKRVRPISVVSSPGPSRRPHRVASGSSASAGRGACDERPPGGPPGAGRARERLACALAEAHRHGGALSGDDDPPGPQGGRHDARGQRDQADETRAGRRGRAGAPAPGARRGPSARRRPRRTSPGSRPTPTAYEPPAGRPSSESTLQATVRTPRAGASTGTTTARGSRGSREGGPETSSPPGPVTRTVEERPPRPAWAARAAPSRARRPRVTRARARRRPGRIRRRRAPAPSADRPRPRDPPAMTYRARRRRYHRIRPRTAGVTSWSADGARR